MTLYKKSFTSIRVTLWEVKAFEKLLFLSEYFSISSIQVLNELFFPIQLVKTYLVNCIVFYRLKLTKISYNFFLF